jgi:exosortase H (IPTLxxWG-CTERM-specific)
MGKAAKHKKERRADKAQSAKARHRASRLVTLKERLRMFLRRHRVMVRSCLIFALCIGLSVFAYSRLVETNVLFSYLTFTAQSTGFILNTFGTGVEVDGTLISSADFSMRIVNECTGIVAMLILLSAVIAYPAKIKQKALGAAIGIPALFLLNLIRLVTLFYIGAFLPDFFETAHLLVWQSLMILAVVVIWFIWARKVAYVRS